MLAHTGEFCFLLVFVEQSFGGLFESSSRPERYPKAHTRGGVGSRSKRAQQKEVGDRSVSVAHGRASVMLLSVVIILVGLLPGPLPPRLLQRASSPLSLTESRSGLLYSERIREYAPSLLPKLEELQDQDLETIDQCACPPRRRTLATP